MDITIDCEVVEIEPLSMERVRVMLKRIDKQDILDALHKFDLDNLVAAIGAQALLDALGEDACREHFKIPDAD